MGFHRFPGNLYHRSTILRTVKPLLKILFLPFLLLIVLTNTSFVGLRLDRLNFYGTFGKHNLQAGTQYFSESKQDSISINTCRFYVSQIELLSDDVVLTKVNYKLIDLFDTTARSIVFMYQTYSPVTSIRFYLGIDSTTNVAGAGSGDLDPTKGMYWAWQSGYINMKLEGNSRLCAKNRNEFQYHLGGYAGANNALQIVELKVKNENVVNINVDVERFLAHVDMINLTHVMSPSANAVQLSKHATEMFSLKE